MHDFSNDISDEANIDKRLTGFLKRLAERIPEKLPSHDELFQLGHAGETLAQYSKTADEQWPSLYASRYHALLLQYDRTMRQSPTWRKFKRNALEQSFSAEQLASAGQLAAETAKVLRDDDAQHFINSDLVQKLEELAEPLQSDKNVLENELPLDLVDAGKELLVADVLESMNNIFKRIAEAALAIGSRTTTVVNSSASTLRKVGKQYAKGIGQGFVKAAATQGPKDGERIFKWLRRLTIISTGVGIGRLMVPYPQVFSWLEPIIRFLF